MRKALFIMALVVCVVVSIAGCGKVGGPRFWWDDRNQVRLGEYDLPPNPGAPAEYGMEERRAAASGEDLSEDDLRDFHTDIDREEEQRKAESSIVNF